MAEVARTAPNTISKPEITFAMIELADSADCNSRRGGWLGYGFKDVTPMFAKQSSVPSLNGGKVPDGRQMLEAFASVNADLYVVSGHQGSLYSSETARWPEPLGPQSWFNAQEYCGFFNEGFHEGRWEHANRDNPNALDAKGVSAAQPATEIYLRTTPPAPGDIATHSQINPLLDGTPDLMAARAARCKAIIVSACNTMTYRAARATWAAAYPNSLIIGNFCRIVSGTWTINAVANAAMTDANFWRDPQSILDQDGMCEKLAAQLLAGFPPTHSDNKHPIELGIAMVYKGTLYFPVRRLRDKKIFVVPLPVADPVDFKVLETAAA